MLIFQGAGQNCPKGKGVSESPSLVLKKPMNPIHFQGANLLGKTTMERSDDGEPTPMDVLVYHGPL